MQVPATNDPDTVRGATAPGLTACSLCAGETLGSSDPHPGGQLARLRQIEADGAARLTLSECLDECERGDVVVARPSTSGRDHAGRPVWFEKIAGDEPTATLCQWLRAGGPGIEPLPRALEPFVIDRSRVDQPQSQAACH